MGGNLVDNHHPHERRFLVAFDYDSTIKEHRHNCKFFSIDVLFPNGTVPEEVKQVQTDHGWDAMLREAFGYLHKAGVTRSQIEANLRDADLVEGTRELFEFISENGGDIIIVSASFKANVECGLEGAGLLHHVQRIYTPSSKFSPAGELVICPFNSDSNKCDLDSSRNMCKGDIIEEYIKERREQGVVYDFTAYSGDGKNDLCPTLRLSENDLAFPRKGYSLDRALMERENSDEKENQLPRAQVTTWTTGVDIIEKLKTKLDV